MGPGIALLTAGALTATAAIVKGEAPSPSIFAGAAIAGGVLLGIAQISPAVASRFATLVVVTAVLTSGAELALGATRLIGA